MKALWLVVGLVGLIACGEAHTTDARFATPERTVATLLGTHGLREVSQEEIRARIAERGAFELRDEATWRLCFTDLERPGGEGMAGYVLGLLAAARDELRYETAVDRAFVMPREGARVVMKRGDDGAYRIVLRESVPERIQRGLHQVEQNARRSRSSAHP